MRSRRDLRLHHPGSSARGVPALSHQAIQPASLQRIRAIEWAAAALGSSPSVSDRYVTQRPAANPRGPPRRSLSLSAARPHGSWGPAAGGLRDGNYAQFPTPARELRPAPSTETPFPLESRVLGLRSAHLSGRGM